MNKKILITIIVSFICITSYSQEERFKSLFMYHFTKYINWPDDFKKGDFIIGVIGNSPIIGELNLLSKKKSIGTQKIVIKRFSSVDDVEDCHVVYLPPGKSYQLSKAIEKLKQKPTLLISEKNDAISNGACINFVRVKGKLKFEISKNNIESHNLEVSTNLLTFGIKK